MGKYEADPKNVFFCEHEDSCVMAGQAFVVPADQLEPGKKEQLAMGVLTSTNGMMDIAKNLMKQYGGHVYIILNKNDLDRLEAKAKELAGRIPTEISETPQ